jgi:hypothetical protein
MLLHSRECSGERRSVEVNAVAEDSLNLAYHGARAESLRSGWNDPSIRPLARSVYSRRKLRAYFSIFDFELLLRGDEAQGGDETRPGTSVTVLRSGFATTAAASLPK